MFAVFCRFLTHFRPDLITPYQIFNEFPLIKFIGLSLAFLVYAPLPVFDLNMNNISNAYSYNDLASLNAITQLGKQDEAKALKEVARQFESMFVGMMLKSMRDANAVFEEGNPLNSNESKFYRQMFDDQLALSMSQGKGMGLADSIYRQMKRQFDIKEKDASDKPVIAEPAGIPIGNTKPQNPFSSLRPNLDLPQFNAQARDLIENITAPVQGLKMELPVGVKVQQLTSSTPVPVLEEHKAEKLKPQEQAISKQSGFSSPQNFIETIWPIAQRVGEEMGVAPKAILAQAALETGWGKHIIHQGDGSNSHNLFGIKADRRWSGKVATVNTLEYRNGLAQKERAPFRVYNSYEESLKDYGAFVVDSSRYQDAVKQGNSIKAYSEGLQKGGYATDPQYAQKIQRIASGDLLNNAINQIKRG